MYRGTFHISNMRS